MSQLTLTGGVAKVNEHLTTVEQAAAPQLTPEQLYIMSRLLKEARTASEKDAYTLNAYDNRGLDPVTAFRLKRPGIEGYKCNASQFPLADYEALVNLGWVVERGIGFSIYLSFQVPEGS